MYTLPCLPTLLAKGVYQVIGKSDSEKVLRAHQVCKYNSSLNFLRSSGEMQLQAAEQRSFVRRYLALHDDVQCVALPFPPRHFRLVVSFGISKKSCISSMALFFFYVFQVRSLVSSLLSYVPSVLFSRFLCVSLRS